jgi:hypothetical protein
MSLSGTCKDQTGFPLGTVSIRQGQAADVSLGISKQKWFSSRLSNMNASIRGF